MSKLSLVFRSTRVRVVLTAMIVAVGAVAVMARMDARPATERAKSWVASHRHVLPQTLEEYAAYPVEYRRAIFDALSPADKSRLWQAQLTAMLAHETLTAQQRAFVEQSIAAATPASFEPGANHPEICPDIASLFSDVKQRKQFNQLGTAVKPAFSARASFVSFVETVRSKLVAYADKDQCNCRNWGVCECGLVACDTSAPCQNNSNCGCIWASECNGICDIGSIGALSVIKKK